jgi:hypothetical protein
MISTKEEARDIARWGSYAAFFIAASTTLLVILRKYAWLDYSAFLDAFLFLIIGIGIRKMSKIAAIGGLVLYLTEIAWKWENVGRTQFGAIQLFWSGIFVVAFVQSVRGALAYHALLKAESGQIPASTEV